MVTTCPNLTCIDTTPSTAAGQLTGHGETSNKASIPTKSELEEYLWETAKKPAGYFFITAHCLFAVEFNAHSPFALDFNAHSPPAVESSPHGPCCRIKEARAQT